MISVCDSVVSGSHRVKQLVTGSKRLPTLISRCLLLEMLYLVFVFTAEYKYFRVHYYPFNVSNYCTVRFVVLKLQVNYVVVKF